MSKAIEGAPASWAAIPFSIQCYDCACGEHIRSLQQAAREGWKRINYDPSASWNFLGYCPDHVPEGDQRVVIIDPDEPTTTEIEETER